MSENNATANSKSTKPPNLMDNLDAETLRAYGFHVAYVQKGSSEVDLKVNSEHAISTTTVDQPLEEPPLVEKRVTGSAFLDKLPLEMRREVYKLLLFNENLAKPHEVAVVNGKELFVVEEYDLFLPILTTCRQVCKEGSAVLYCMNTFFWDCRDNYFRTPIMRQRQPNGGFAFRRADEFRELPALRKVQRWKIIISSSLKEGDSYPDYAFDLLCRELCRVPFQSLEVAVYLAIRDVATYFPIKRCHDDYPWTAGALLQPLHMFRNLSQFKIATATGNDHLGEELVPPPAGFEDCFETFELGVAKKEYLEKLVTGNSFSRATFRLHDRLVEYASAFERHDDFKSDMANPNLRDQSSSSSHRTNPFVMKPSHPVETGLWNTKIKHNETESNGTTFFIFFERRIDVLEYLEPQYQRIVAAATATTDYVKSLKKRGCMLDPAGIHRYCYVTREDLTEALLVLEDYAAAFVRDVPPATRRNIRLIQPDFDLCYATKMREVCLKWMGEFLNFWSKEEGPIPARSLAKFVHGFRTVVDDIDSQYLQIRKARTALYEFDDFRRPAHWRPIDLELRRCDEMIDWSVREPEIGAGGDPSDSNEYETWYENVAMA